MIALLGFACPIVCAWVAVRFAHRHPVIRAAIATAVVGGFALIAPLAVLAAHCTSGDCLERPINEPQT